jgi:hypothetical protein
LKSKVDLKERQLYVNRKNNGISSVHPLYGPEIRALRKLKIEYPETQYVRRDYVFTSERKSPMIDLTFRKMLVRAGDEAISLDCRYTRICCNIKQFLVLCSNKLNCESLHSSREFRGSN